MIFVSGFLLVLVGLGLCLLCVWLDNEGAESWAVASTGIAGIVAVLAGVIGVLISLGIIAFRYLP